jgi:hypothetical protein
MNILEGVAHAAELFARYHASGERIGGLFCRGSLIGGVGRRDERREDNGDSD